MLELKAEGLSNVATAQVLGVDERTIRRADGAAANAAPAPLPPEEDDVDAAANAALIAPPPVNGHNHRAQGTGDNEWYTPAEYVDLARVVLGAIDLAVLAFVAGFLHVHGVAVQSGKLAGPVPPSPVQSRRDLCCLVGFVLQIRPVRFDSGSRLQIDAVFIGIRLGSTGHFLSSSIR